MSDLSPDAKDLWERAKKGAFEPTDAQVERVRQAVLQRIAAAPTASPRGSLGSLPRWAKVAGLVVGLGAVVATGMKLGSREPQAPIAAPSAAPVVAAPEVPVVETPSTAEGVTPERGPAPDKGKEPTRASPSARSSATDTQADTLPEQVRIITEARVALRQRAFAQALAKASEYEARYPKGVFVEEELAIRAMSLCALGRDKEAARARDTLERTVPNSRQLDRVRAACTKPAP
jgi:hypothetical protein